MDGSFLFIDSVSLRSSFAATRDLVFVWRSGDFFHAGFVATRILTIPLRVLETKRNEKEKNATLT